MLQGDERRSSTCQANLVKQVGQTENQNKEGKEKQTTTTDERDYITVSCRLVQYRRQKKKDRIKDKTPNVSRRQCSHQEKAPRWRRRRGSAGDRRQDVAIEFVQDTSFLLFTAVLSLLGFHSTRTRHIKHRRCSPRALRFSISVDFVSHRSVRLSVSACHVVPPSFPRGGINNSWEPVVQPQHH